MSILKDLKTKQCPHCGCTVVENERIEIDRNSGDYRLHCNGGHWETRTFSCGYVVKYIPNFERDEESNYSLCTKSEKYILMQEHKQQLAKDLKVFCEAKGISNNEYERMKYYIK